MTKYRIRNMNDETIMVKSKEQMDEWIKKWNVKDKDWNKVDLRKAKGGMVVRCNGKMLRVHT